MNKILAAILAGVALPAFSPQLPAQVPTELVVTNLFGDNGNPQQTAAANATGLLEGDRVLLVVDAYLGADFCEITSTLGSNPVLANLGAGAPNALPASTATRHVFGVDVTDPILATEIRNGTALLTVTGPQAGPTFRMSAILRLDKPRRGRFTSQSSNPAGAYVEIQPTGQVFIEGGAQTPGDTVELWTGDIVNPGEKIGDFIPNTQNYFETFKVLPDQVNAATQGNAHVQIRDPLGNVRDRVDIDFGDPFKNALVATVVDNGAAIIELQMLPTNGITGTIDVSQFPVQVFQANIVEIGGSASLAFAVNTGGGVFQVLPFPLSPSQVMAFEQNNVEVQLVTSTGTVSVPIKAATPPQDLGGGSPGSDGRTAYANFRRQPLIGNGYNILIVGGTPNAPAIPVLGVQMLSPPLFLAPQGFDDIVFVDPLLVLPFTVLDANGFASIRGAIPNDPIFVGMDVFGQVLLLTGADGLAFSNAFYGLVGPC